MDHAPHPIALVLADPNILFRSGMVRLLEAQPDLRVVGETGECLEAVQLAAQLRPQVILLEVELNGCDGPTLVGLIKEEFPAIHPVFLTSVTDPDQVLACILAGASGFLHKTITPDELFTRLRGLAQGEAAIALTTVSTLFERLHASNYALYVRTPPQTNLTPRECEILTLVARGLTNKRIGALLQISEHTVRNHLGSICQKLNLDNRLQVAVYSVMHGLVSIDGIR
jgi:DNA-binding NarL/FixJ family response regulator